jgi:phosphoesterase recJ domain protein
MRIQTEYSSVEITAAVLIFILLAIIAYLNWQLAMLCGIVVFAAYMYVWRTIRRGHHLRRAQFDRMAKGITQASTFALQNLPVGIVIIDENNKICWCNSVFKAWVPSTNSDKTMKLSGFIPTLRIDKYWGKSGFFNEAIDGKYYRVLYKTLAAPKSQYSDVDSDELEQYMAFYFDDITEIQVEKNQAMSMVPAFGFITMDNIEDLRTGLSDIEYTQLWSDMNRLIVTEIDQHDGFIRNATEDTYSFSISKAEMLNMMEKKFNLLDKIRALTTSKHIPPTISMGIALTTDSVKVQGEKAKAALEIALGRGGDQVCVYHGEEVKFFGGKTSGNEKNTRVRARVVSHALHEIMLDSDRVLVMGHDREDYDSIGASVGVAAMARALNKPVHIALSANPTAVRKLVEVLVDHEDFQGMIINEEEATQFVTDNTVVIVTDVHRSEMVAAPAALKKSARRVVIDHHRRGSDFIESPMLTYLEPSTSSTSELVSELIQYFPDHVEIKPIEASALYAGIVVDTKNFVVQTGARTFEAASFLRRSGADVSVVRHLFMDNFEGMRMRSAMLAAAEEISHMAFTEAPETAKNATVIAAQTGDKLITLEGIEASFVFYVLPDGGIGVSARSQGKVNVQVIMEAVGGGGHRTVAGAQIYNKSMTEARQWVTSVAVSYMTELEEESKEE